MTITNGFELIFNEENQEYELIQPTGNYDDVSIIRLTSADMANLRRTIFFVLAAERKIDE
jgi:hypothetical protein